MSDQKPAWWPTAESKRHADAGCAHPDECRVPAHPTTPTIAEAEGMLAALRRNHECTEACTGTVRLGDGHVVTLTCPWSPGRLDMEDPKDRRIVGSVYASEARAALQSAMRS